MQMPLPSGCNFEVNYRNVKVYQVIGSWRFREIAHSQRTIIDSPWNNFDSDDRRNTEKGREFFLSRINFRVAWQAGQTALRQ